MVFDRGVHTVPKDPQPRKDQTQRPTTGSIYRTLGLLGALGLVMVAAIVLGMAAGYFLGRLLDAPRAGMVVGMLTGVTGGFVGVYRIIIRSPEQQ